MGTVGSGWMEEGLRKDDEIGRPKRGEVGVPRVGGNRKRRTQDRGGNLT